jgi:hypothetical protein
VSDNDDIRALKASRDIIDDLLAEHRGLKAMRRNMRNSQAGVRSPNLEPHRGDRYEDLELPEGGTVKVRVPTNDPTGEAVAGRADEASQALTASRTLYKRLYALALQAAAERDEWAPVEGAQRPVGGPGEDWCSSCWRSNQHCEPVSGHHAGRCRWCGDWKREYGEDPPLTLLRLHHQGERITVQMVERYTRKKAG